MRPVPFGAPIGGTILQHSFYSTSPLLISSDYNSSKLNLDFTAVQTSEPRCKADVTENGLSNGLYSDYFFFVLISSIVHIYGSHF